MNITTEQSYTVFRNDYNQYTFYKLGISKRDATGKWINGYIRCKFKKDVVLENKTRIYLKKAWLSFDLKEKETIPFIFISEFETIDETIENSKKSAEKSAEAKPREKETRKEGAKENSNRRNQSGQHERGKERDKQPERDRQQNEKQGKNLQKNKDKKGEKPQEKNGRPKYDYRPYENVSLYELVYGKRERPAPEKPKKEQLTPDSIVKFCRQGKWGYKDWKGNVLIQPVYDNAYAFHEDRACVEKDGLLGYIDTKNVLVIDFRYDSATSFSQGLAAVSIGEKSGYIDKDGAEVLPMEFDVATGFENGKAIVRQDGRWGVLDRETLKVLWR